MELVGLSEELGDAMKLVDCNKELDDDIDFAIVLFCWYAEWKDVIAEETLVWAFGELCKLTLNPWDNVPCDDEEDAGFGRTEKESDVDKVTTVIVDGVLCFAGVVGISVSVLTIICETFRLVTVCFGVFFDAIFDPCELGELWGDTFLESGCGVEPGDVSFIVGDERKVVPLTANKILVVVSLIVDVEGGFVGVIVIVEVLEKFVDENRIVFSIPLVLQEHSLTSPQLFSTGFSEHDL